MSENIYILLSIKTRIETLKLVKRSLQAVKFISYYPLKQGLKLFFCSSYILSNTLFISYYPLKQGLKQ